MTSSDTQDRKMLRSSRRGLTKRMSLEQKDLDKQRDSLEKQQSLLRLKLANDKVKLLKQREHFQTAKHLQSSRSKTLIPKSDNAKLKNRKRGGSSKACATSVKSKQPEEKNLTETESERKESFFDMSEEEKSLGPVRRVPVMLPPIFLHEKKKF